MHVNMEFKIHKFLPRTGLIYIYFKTDKKYFFNNSNLAHKKLYNMNLRRLPSHHGEVSVMTSEKPRSQRSFPAGGHQVFLYFVIRSNLLFFHIFVHDKDCMV